MCGFLIVLNELISSVELNVHRTKVDGVLVILNIIPILSVKVIECYKWRLRACVDTQWTPPVRVWEA